MVVVVEGVAVVVVASVEVVEGASVVGEAVVVVVAPSEQPTSTNEKASNAAVA